MDLAQITDFIALDNPQRAEQFEAELLDHAQRSPAHHLRTWNGRISNRVFGRALTGPT